MQDAEPETPCEGKILAQKYSGETVQCLGEYRVSWSPAFGKYLCDECRSAATAIALHQISQDDWVKTHASASQVRLG